jgi:prepilin-type N-terminal cleavage/methylation domain-containing protein
MSRGFTLIEIVIIIVVLGILAAVAIPKYFNMTSAANESTVRAFGATLKEASEIYLARAAVEGSTRKPLVQSFNDFVAWDDNGGSDRNTLAVNNSIRHLLADPNSEVFSSDGLTITLNLKGGASAVFRFNPTSGGISETYTGF